MGSFNPPTLDFLTPEQKKDWHNTRQLFYITKVRTAAGKYGLTHTFTLQPVSDKGKDTGAPVLMSLTDNPRRADLVDYVKDELSSGSDRLGPCVLQQVESESGNPAWFFAPAD